MFNQDFSVDILRVNHGYNVYNVYNRENTGSVPAVYRGLKIKLKN
jgi:hypothetical protein